MTHVRLVRSVSSSLSRSSSLRRYLSLGLVALVCFAVQACDSSRSPTVPSAFLLEVTAPPEGAGSIQSQPAGIDCPGVCSAEFQEGDVVYLHVSPSPGWGLLGWSGACTGTGDFCSLLMSGAMEVNVFFDGTPDPPSEFSVQAVSPYQVDLHWQDNSPIETGFEIERQVAPSPDWTVLAVTPPDTESYSDTDLEPETTYTYRIRACRNEECSVFGGEIGATTSPEPTLEAIAITQTEVELSWPEDRWNGTGFRVEQSPDGSTGWVQIGTAEADASTYSVTDLLPGTTYHFRLRVCDATGCSEVSDVASATPPPPLSFVAGHLYHTCGITLAGEAYCWGYGVGGRLGTGDGHMRRIPTAVVGGLTFSDISMGRYHTCAVATDGKAYCWGGGAQNGVLGIGDVGEVSNAYTPIPVSGDLTFKSIGSGSSFNCGLTLEGKAYCWGDGYAGKLGTGGVEDQFSPAPVVGGLTFESIAVGETHACGLTDSRETWCWGGGGYGPEPVSVAGAPAFASIYAGNHTCGLTPAGEAYCWGDGAYGGLGNGAMDDQVSPVPVAGGLSFQSLSLGTYHSCGLTTDGKAYCWGYGGYGALGNGGGADTAIPVPVEGGLVFSFIGLGKFQSCALTGVGQAFCWGMNWFGQVGNGSHSESQIYYPVPTVWR